VITAGAFDCTVVLFTGMPLRTAIGNGGPVGVARAVLVIGSFRSHEVVSPGDTFVLYLQIPSDYDFAIGIIVLCKWSLKGARKSRSFQFLDGAQMITFGLCRLCNRTRFVYHQRLSHLGIDIFS
jgi:hypothetical protein